VCFFISSIRRRASLPLPLGAHSLFWVIPPMAFNTSIEYILLLLSGLLVLIGTLHTSIYYQFVASSLPSPMGAHSLFGSSRQWCSGTSIYPTTHIYVTDWDQKAIGMIPLRPPRFHSGSSRLRSGFHFIVIKALLTNLHETWRLWKFERAYDRAIVVCTRKSHRTI
jgi:hypothetical protein